MESDSRERISGLITKRSTTISMVCFYFFQFDRLRQVIDQAIHANPYIAAFSGSLELFYVFALSSSNDRRQHHNFRAFRQGHYLIYNLVYGLLLNLLSAHRAMRDPDSGIQKPEIIIDLRYGADCGSRVFEVVF